MAHRAFQCGQRSSTALSAGLHVNPPSSPPPNPAAGCILLYLSSVLCSVTSNVAAISHMGLLQGQLIKLIKLKFSSSVSLATFQMPKSHMRPVATILGTAHIENISVVAESSLGQLYLAFPLCTVKMRAQVASAIVLQSPPSLGFRSALLLENLMKAMGITL